MVAAMDAVGVDGAVLVSPFAMYDYDASYVLNGYAAHPGRFALVKPVDPGNPAVAETAATKGTVGIRLFLLPAVSADPGLNRILAAAARHSVPVNMACPAAHGGIVDAPATAIARATQATATEKGPLVTDIVYPEDVFM
jgi:L-fuconolactonase